jgi:hypothetical protein
MVSRRNNYGPNKGAFIMMSASRNGLRLRHIPPYSRRKDFCSKVRRTEEKIQHLKKEGKWRDVSHLEYVLRNAWWGYKRYPFISR